MIPASIAIHDVGLATLIGGVNKDASGKSPEVRYSKLCDNVRADIRHRKLFWRTRLTV